MSRYKKASYNEAELSEIEGVKPILRITRDEKLELIELFFEQQKQKQLDLKKARETISRLLYNSLFVWENNARTNKKESGSEDITKDDIDAFVVDNLFELWLEILDVLKIIDKDKLQDIKKQHEAQVSKEEKDTNPN